MYYFYILLFFLVNIWLLNKITSNIRNILLNYKIDKSHPIVFNVLTNEFKKNRPKKNGFMQIAKQLYTLL